MYIILGASGNVGATVVDRLLQNDLPVKGVTRSRQHAGVLQKKGAKAAIADAKDLPALQEAFADGTVLFAITAETFKEKDVLGETQEVLQNYRAAVEAAGIEKVVGLSSVGAQYNEGTGNLLMSHMLEHAFDGLPVRKIFIRPSYYFSNWLMYLPVVKEKGILPTFFPPEMRIAMMSPQDVAEIAANILAEDQSEDKIYELEGPQEYSSIDVAQAFSGALGMEVKVQQIPREQWEETLRQQEFSEDAIKNFVDMTEAVVSGKIVREGKELIKGDTALETYIRHHCP